MRIRIINDNMIIEDRKICKESYSDGFENWGNYVLFFYELKYAFIRFYLYLLSLIQFK